jgi:hypothetical protein
MTDRELHDPRTIERICTSHGLSTMGEARDMVADEVKRRVTQTTWDGQR